MTSDPRKPDTELKPDRETLRVQVAEKIVGAIYNDPHYMVGPATTATRETGLRKADSIIDLVRAHAAQTAPASAELQEALAFVGEAALIKTEGFIAAEVMEHNARVTAKVLLLQHALAHPPTGTATVDREDLGCFLDSKFGLIDDPWEVADGILKHYAVTLRSCQEVGGQKP